MGALPGRWPCGASGPLALTQHRAPGAVGGPGLGSTSPLLVSCTFGSHSASWQVAPHTVFGGWWAGECSSAFSLLLCCAPSNTSACMSLPPLGASVGGVHWPALRAGAAAVVVCMVFIPLGSARMEVPWPAHWVGAVAVCMLFLLSGALGGGAAWHVHLVWAIFVIACCVFSFLTLQCVPGTLPVSCLSLLARKISIILHSSMYCFSGWAADGLSFAYIPHVVTLARNFTCSP